MHTLGGRWMLLRNNLNGVSTIEYAVISGLIVLAIVVAFSTVTSDLDSVLTKVAKAITTKPKL